MTAEEISFVAQARQENMKELSQIFAWLIHGGAALIGVAVNEPSKFPKLEDAFPSLFEQQPYQDWRVMKERMEDFAQAKKESKLNAASEVSAYAQKGEQYGKNNF